MRNATYNAAELLERQPREPPTISHRLPVRPANASEPCAATQWIQNRHRSFRPRIGIVLGSGLGDFAQAIEQPTRIAYREIPGFPRTESPWSLRTTRPRTPRRSPSGCPPGPMPSVRRLVARGIPKTPAHRFGIRHRTAYPLERLRRDQPKIPQRPGRRDRFAHQLAFPVDKFTEPARFVRLYPHET